jgi:hypothetical protein
VPHSIDKTKSGEVCPGRRPSMSKSIKVAVAGAVLTIAVALPASAGVTKSVRWVCDVPGEGLVTFVSAPEAARHGIDTANTTAGQVFLNNFGEVCTVQ